MKNLQNWDIVASELAFDHRWYKVRRDTVRLPNGTLVDDYFLSVRPDIALVFPITPEQNIVFVRQYRHGAGEILLELPAGTFDPTIEQAEVAARRELEEETGYVAHHLIPLGVLYDNPVKETNKIHLFLAQDLTLSGKQSWDITEDIDVVLVPVTEVMQRIVQGEISVSGSIAAVCLGLSFLGNL